MAFSSELYPALSRDEKAQETRARSTLRQLVWRFIGCVGLIVATVGMATEVARWTGWH
jgi:hypothetical protein